MKEPQSERSKMAAARLHNGDALHITVFPQLVIVRDVK